MNGYARKIMKIICVDDEKLILDLTVSMCRALPQKPDVVGFQKAAEAIAWLPMHKADIALLDINLSDMNGLILAAKIKELSPNTAIIFLTGYSEYALDALSMHASGYLMKPVSEERLKAEIDYAAENIGLKKSRNSGRDIFVQTFGCFDVLVNGKPIRFPRSRSKELLAYLVDRYGSYVSRATAFSVIYEGQTYNRPMQKQFDVILRSLRQALEDYGIDDILEVSRKGLRVIPERFNCDLYRFYEGDVETINAYRGEYMSEYSWASITEANISEE